MVASRRVRLIAALVAVLAVAAVLWTITLRDDGVSTTSHGSEPVQTWTRAAASPLSPRYDATVLRVGGRLFVGGGYDRGPCPGRGIDCAIVHPALRDGALYDPTSDTWQSIARAPAGIGSAVAVGDLVFTWTHAGPYVYEPAQDRWSPARRVFRGFSIRSPGRLTAFGDRFYTGYEPGTFGEVEPVQECDARTHVCRRLPIDRHPLIHADLHATALGPVWIGQPGGMLFDRGPVVADLMRHGRWHRYPVARVRRLGFGVLDGHALVGRDVEGIPRRVLRLPSGEWTALRATASSAGLRDLIDAGDGWAVGHGEIVGPDLAPTPLGAPPGLRHRRDASSVIAGSRLYVFGGYDGVNDRSAELWIRRLP